MSRNFVIQHLRGVLASMPALEVGELYFATDVLLLYVGSASGNIPVAGGASAQATVGFGVLEPTEDTTARVTVPAPWVLGTSILCCSVVEGADHTDDEIAAEQVTATIGNIQAGVSFDVVLSSMNGSSGNFLVNVIEG